MTTEHQWVIEQALSQLTRPGYETTVEISCIHRAVKSSRWHQAGDVVSCPPEAHPRNVARAVLTWPDGAVYHGPWVDFVRQEPE